MLMLMGPLWAMGGNMIQHKAAMVLKIGSNPKGEFHCFRWLLAAYKVLLQTGFM